MSFLYPSFLWAFTLLIIPIIIHLFNFRKAKKIYFSNVRFLETVKKKSSSKLRIKHLLALAARLLMLAFLVLTFAQPFMPKSNQAEQSNQVFMFLDNSYSMSVPVLNNLSAMDEAYGILSSVVELYPRATSFKFLTNDFAPFSNTSKSKDEIEGLITELTLSGKSRDFSSIMSRLSPPADQAEPTDVVVVSDFQSSYYSSSPTQLDTINNYKFVPIQTEVTTNVFVDSVYLTKPFLVNGEENQLGIEVRNSGSEDALDILIQLFIKDNQVATSSVDVPANSTAPISFDLNFEFEEFNRCRVVIEDYPISFDNEHFFVLQLANRVKVTEVYEQSPRFQSVYANRELFDYEHYDIANIDFGRASESNLLLVNGLTSINNSLVPLKEEVLQKGGSLVLVPGSSIDSSSYATFASLPFSTKTQRTKTPLARLNTSNPFFENVFEDMSERYAMPQATQAYTWPSRGESLLTFRNGRPFLSRFSQSRGNIYLLSSPLDTTFTNFHRHALFVPVMYRAAATSVSNTNPLSYDVSNGLVEITLDSISVNSVYHLRKGQLDLIPDQRVQGNRLIMQLPIEEIETGYFDIVLEEEYVGTIAINHNQQESEIRQMTLSEIRAMVGHQPNVEVALAISSEEFRTELQAAAGDDQYWKYTLVLCLIFLLAEVLILRFL